MIKKLLLAVVFSFPFFIHSDEIKETKQLNKIHANPFNDSYIVIFDGSPESFSIDKISIDKPKENSQSVGNYHAVGTSDYVIIYNTQTGEHKKVWAENYIVNKFNY